MKLEITEINHILAIASVLIFIYILYKKNLPGKRKYAGLIILSVLILCVTADLFYASRISITGQIISVLSYILLIISLYASSLPDTYKNIQKEILENAQEILYRTNLEGFVTWLNPGARILGYTVEEGIGIRLADLYVEPGGREKFLRQLQLNKGKVSNYEALMRHKSGNTVWVSTNAQFYFDEEGKLAGVEGSVRDITEKKLSEMALVREADTLKRAEQIGHFGSFEWSFEDGSVYWSDELYKILEKEKINFTPSYDEFMALVDQKDRKRLIDMIEHSLKDRNQPPDMFLQMKLDSGKIKYIKMQGYITRTDAGDNVKMTGTAHDITEARLNEEKMEHFAHYDFLTDLPNRLLFKDRMMQAIASAGRNGKKAALFFLDLDRFKVVNDTLGHSVGDILLKKVAERLQKNIRETDTVARLGGDEFTIILTDISRTEDIEIFAKNILDLFSEEFRVNDYEFFLGTSIGISVYPEDGRDWEILLQKADQAMYHSKDLGKNVFQFYSENMNASNQERLELEKELRYALKNREFILYYQPQVDLKSGKINGVEVLTYWNRKGKIIGPGDFIPITEESGTIVPLGEWVIREACRQNRAWQKMGIPPLKVSVNLSAKQCNKKLLLRTLDQILEETELSGECLELELTESMMMNTERTYEMLEELKKRNVKIAIDDFGTGFSSLNYLKRFPIDSLKIDKSFIDDVLTDPDDASIAISIISLGQTMKMEIIAEGVETREQMEFLQKNNCDSAQGYFFNRPLTVEKIEELLIKNIPYF